MTEAHKAKLLAANLGHHRSAETKAKISVAQKGHVMPESVRLAIHKAHVGRHYVMSAETKAKISAAHRGKPGHTHMVSAEARARLSEAHKGKPLSEIARAAFEKAHVGSHASDETKAKMSAARKQRVGPLAPCWKGGIETENHRIRKSPEYVAWRTAVFERDDYTCQDCGQHGGYLEAHHIHGFAEYPDERFVVDNGKTLCWACHNKTKGKGAEAFAREA